MAEDSVASQSGFLVKYMSGHPDTLVAYAKWYGKVEQPISSASMMAIDSKGMNLKCKLKAGGEQDVRVTFSPPLAGYNDVKPRLLEMKAIAQENLGMIKTPTIQGFRYPPRGTFSLFMFAIPLSYLYFAPYDNASPLFLPANALRSLVGARPINGLAVFIAFAHVLESVYTLSLCRKHHTGFFASVTYVVSTLLMGMPVWRDLRRRIQTARIDSVMKVE
ncbi:hypothetical protein FISHEDRAFT_39746 [Fistulina hepatica ATCC 64428]|uniref:DUF2470 domain-containing protein n=1 Tax=Fistulina hepatica ATCC 64428 TaxID=1128425 RepID=A0A0D7AJ18_9AGAR|nr:hypothetical protein FISHEDRAFT_39746 [Fistulina hepatica ATCC 64428]